MRHVAVVDDEASMREYLSALLTRKGFGVVTAGSLAEFKALAEKAPLDLVISDMKLGKDSGLAVLDAARALKASPEVIIITAFATPASAVEAMRRGAYDYICKPFDNDELLLLAQRALEKRSLIVENQQLKASLGGGPVVGTSARMQEVLALVDKVAVAAKATVLISGESGTGKEVVARLIHQRSPRSAQPFVPVNCAAIAEGVLESELFGHLKGAFTGATSDRPGILVTAGEGTVLLDEIGELPLSIQVKLLRVLQERTVKPVGASTEVPFAARILAATNKKLDAEVKAGRFREDLFHRLNVIGIELPTLRQRREDIVPLASHFLEKMAVELGRPNLRFSAEALSAMESYAFPGNVRQLQNIVERAATLADTDVLDVTSLPPPVLGRSETGPTVEVALPEGFSLERHLDTVERSYLLEALRRASSVKVRAAALLGLSFRSFRYRLAKQGLAEKDEGQ